MCGWKVSSEAKLKGDNYPPKLADWLWQFEPCFVRSISSFPGETEPKAPMGHGVVTPTFSVPDFNKWLIPNAWSAYSKL